jgi:hypothetical protein
MSVAKSGVPATALAGGRPDAARAGRPPYGRKTSRTSPAKAVLGPRPYIANDDGGLLALHRASSIPGVMRPRHQSPPSPRAAALGLDSSADRCLPILRRRGASGPTAPFVAMGYPFRSGRASCALVRSGSLSPRTGNHGAESGARRDRRNLSQMDNPLVAKHSRRAVRWLVWALCASGARLRCRRIA